MKTVLVVGASRGIGLEFAKQYADEGYQVIATARDPDQAVTLHALANTNNKIHIEKLDVTDESSIKSLAEKITQPIDLLIINAGIIAKHRSLNDTTAEDMLTLFQTNTLGHFLVAKYFLANVLASQQKQIATLTSRMGSIADNTSGQAYAYRASKSALNAIMKSLAFDTQDQGVHVSILHPGFVTTEMNNGRGLISAEESVKRLRNVLKTARQHESGSFLSHDGSVLPW